MVVLHTAAVLLTLVALSGYLNYRYIRLPNALVVMIVAALASLSMVLLGKTSWDGLVFQVNQSLPDTTDYPALMQGVLGLILFAAAMQINLQEFRQQRVVILSLGLLGALVPMLLIAAVLWVILQAFAMQMPFAYCLIFGALITPTDATSLFGALRAIRITRTHETTLAGEALLNNLVTLLVFLGLLAAFDVSVPSSNPEWWLWQDILGGVVLGMVLGWFLFTLLKDVEQHTALALWLTVGLALGGLATAYWFDLSAPLALLIAGLFVARNGALSDALRDQLKVVWGVFTEVLVVGLLILLGLEVLRLGVHVEYLLVSLALIPIVVLARFVGVGLPILFWQRRRRFSSAVPQAMTWGAVHGGMSVALILMLPPSQVRDILLVITYSVILISVMVQGLLLARILDEAG